MNETLNEKIVYRGEMSRELTIDEVDSNFKKVANPIIISFAPTLSNSLPAGLHGGFLNILPQFGRASVG